MFTRTVSITPDLSRSRAKLVTSNTASASGILRSAVSAARTTALLAGCVATALAQVPATPPTTVTLPKSSIAGPTDAGVNAHTNLQILGTGGGITGNPQFYGPPFGPGDFYETPASLACIYGLQSVVPGCNPYVATLNPNGGSRAIAIVDAYDNPNAYSDLQTFTGQFGVAAINPSSFITVFAPAGGAVPGSCTGPAVPPPPAKGTGWDLEASLDIEWAHAMAPLATLFLVEAQSNSFKDLLCAVSVASSIVNASGGGEVSMSWGSGEFSSEVSMDAVFTTPKVVYFASAGDGPGASYPSASPNVVSVGGTTISRNETTGNFRFENVWQYTGGGPSRVEPRPSYQNGIVAIVGSQRGTPDVSADANPYTGVWVFNSSLFGPAWFIVGGTSVSSPIWAGISNAAGFFAASSGAELTKLYSDPHSNFNDITVGTCGPFMGFVAVAGWDFCSGQGSPRSYAGK